MDDDKTDLDELEQDESRPAAVNESEGFIGTLGSQRLVTASRQETEVLKPAISSQSVFYKHRRDMSSFDNSRLDGGDSRNMTQIFQNNSLAVQNILDKDLLFEELQKEADENE